MQSPKRGVAEVYSVTTPLATASMRPAMSHCLSVLSDLHKGVLPFFQLPARSPSLRGLCEAHHPLQLLGPFGEKERK